MVKKKIVGRKNTVVKAIPKSLYKTLLNIQLELELKNKNKKRKITLLQAGVELARRFK